MLLVASISDSLANDVPPHQIVASVAPSFSNQTASHDLVAAVAVSSSVANTAPASDLAALDVMDLYIGVRDMSNCCGCHSGECYGN